MEKNHHEQFSEALDLLDYTTNEKNIINRIRANIDENPAPLNLINMRKAYEKLPLACQYIDAVMDIYNAECKRINKRKGKNGAYKFPSLIAMAKKAEEATIKRAEKYKPKPAPLTAAARLMEAHKRAHHTR